MKISFVIPALNEEKSVGTLYEELAREMAKIAEPYEIIFIDDGSTDGTFNQLSLIGKKDKNVSVIKLRGNWGKATALQVGFDHSKGDVIITMDADLQDNPVDIPCFLEKITQGYDLVVGWKKVRHDPVTKILPSRVVNFLVRLMSGVTVHDVNCGFKAYRREVVKNLHLYGDLYRFIPILAARQNFKIVEIPVNHRARLHGKSKYGFGRFLSGWLDILTVFFLVRYLRRPGHFFGGIGIVSFSVGFIIGVYITFLRLTTGSIQNRQPLLFLGVLLLIIGIQLVSTGLLAEMLIFSQKKADENDAIDASV